jgi:hypothetical protein
VLTKQQNRPVLELFSTNLLYPSELKDKDRLEGKCWTAHPMPMRTDIIATPSLFVNTVSNIRNDSRAQDSITQSLYFLKYQEDSMLILGTNGGK